MAHFEPVFDTELKKLLVMSVCQVHLLSWPSYVPHDVNNIHSIVSII